MSHTTEQGKHTQLQDRERYGTPGPWEIDSGMVQTAYDHECKTPRCGTRIPIAYMDRKPGNGTLPCERDANARLIAAAPELLAACKAVLRDLDKPWSVVAKAHFSELLHTAIARAEGKV